MGDHRGEEVDEFAATPKQVPPPVPNRANVPPLGRSFSILSEKALMSLESLNEQLVTYEDELHRAEDIYSKMYDSADELIKIKNDLAQLNGKVDKLQMVGIDGVITAELHSGRDVAKTTRKELNKRAGELLEAVRRLHSAASTRIGELGP